METRIIAGIAAAACLLAGCGQKNNAASKSAAPSAALPALTAWRQGDQALAIQRFLETDWSQRPLFPEDSPLSLTERAFASLSLGERQSKLNEVTTQLDSLKRLGAAVAQAGQAAAAKQDFTIARKHFVSLQQCGQALDRPEALAIARLVGQSLKKMAGAELRKPGT